jgi:hypothetical protein
MRFVRGHYYCITSHTNYWLVEFRKCLHKNFHTHTFFVLATKKESDTIGVQFPTKTLRDSKLYTIKEVPFIDLLLYFGDYTTRRYRDILGGKIPGRVLSKTTQGKALAQTKKIKSALKLAHKSMINE